VWEPGVRTAHRHPRRLRVLLVDQYRRGARTAMAWTRLERYRPREVAAIALRRFPSSLQVAWRSAENGERRWIAAASLLLPAAALAYAAGALEAARSPHKGETP
ncbi:MAG TPA: hypothetical protein VG477_17975, partial [Thermoanaerobaculia bacterium]|nr:hypothetical protein [Thermoanaerobaculia bacterium]